MDQIEIYPGNKPSIKLNAVQTTSLIIFTIGCFSVFRFSNKSTYKYPMIPNSELLHPKKAI